MTGALLSCCYKLAWYLKFCLSPYRHQIMNSWHIFSQGLSRMFSGQPTYHTLPLPSGIHHSIPHCTLRFHSTSYSGNKRLIFRTIKYMHYFTPVPKVVSSFIFQIRVRLHLIGVFLSILGHEDFSTLYLNSNWNMELSFFLQIKIELICPSMT